MLVRLAQKAFHPGRIPFPLLHIDTAYKFPEMYAFRDRTCAGRSAWNCVCMRNEAALAADANPWDLGHGQVLRLAQDAGAARCAPAGQLRRRDRRRAPRGRTLAREGAHLLLSRRARPMGSEEPAPRTVEPVQRAHPTRVRASASFPCRTGPSSTSGATSTLEQIPVVPLYFAAERERRAPGRPAPSGRCEDAPAARREARGSLMVPLPHARLLSHAPARCARPRATVAGDHRRARGTRHSERMTRVIDHDQDGSMEQKKREGYF